MLTDYCPKCYSPVWFAISTWTEEERYRRGDKRFAWTKSKYKCSNPKCDWHGDNPK